MEQEILPFGAGITIIKDGKLTVLLIKQLMNLSFASLLRQAVKVVLRSELDFAEDCKHSGFKPVLLVLDPTPSTRLFELTKEFARVNGKAYIGNDAWQYLEEQAEATMARFVENYVRRPIAELDTETLNLLNLSIKNVSHDSSFLVELSNEQSYYTWTIPRNEDEALAEDLSEQESE